MDGVINIYKEKGYTSFHAVAVIRHFTGEKKVGHTGTLDPDAEGVLPICIGKATKLVGQLTDTDKTYKAVMQLGIKTDTQDITGKVLEEMEPETIRFKLGNADVEAAFSNYKGDISQRAPMYSAVKVGGVKLVDAARKGKTLEQPVRHVTIYDYSEINVESDSLEISFTVSCSKGTYVRTICQDVGDFLGIPACMKSLIRTRAAGQDIEDSIPLSAISEIAERGDLKNYIIPTDRFLLDYEKMYVNEAAVKRLVFGNYLYDEDLVFPIKKQGIYRIYDQNETFYALYRYDTAENCFKCEKMFH